jgi:hypothetical protein
LAYSNLHRLSSSTFSLFSFMNPCGSCLVRLIFHDYE